MSCLISGVQSPALDGLLSGETRLLQPTKSSIHPCKLSIHCDKPSIRIVKDETRSVKASTRVTKDSTWSVKDSTRSVKDSTRNAQLSARIAKNPTIQPRMGKFPQNLSPLTRSVPRAVATGSVFKVRQLVPLTIQDVLNRLHDTALIPEPVSTITWTWFVLTFRGALPEK